VCDTLVTITDEGVLLAKNSDRDPNESQYLDWVPAIDHEPGSRVRATWSEIDQVDHTHAVLLSRPWWIWGAEMGANEHGVVIGNEAVFTDGAAEESDGLIGMDLLRLGLERSTDRHGAVAVIVDLLERHGQGGSCSRAHPRFRYDNSFLVADPGGAVVLETAGRRWATEEVRGPGRSISNGLTIAGFADAHGDRLRSRVSQCVARRARTESAAAVAVDAGDLMTALRDHGPTGLPVFSPLNGALSAPCAHAGGLVTSTQTTASWVSDLRARPLHWATATAAPCTSLFKPVRVDAPADLGPTPADLEDPRTTWWRHERLHRAAMVDPATLLPRFTPERDRVEAAWRADPPSTATAFAQAEQLERGWLSDVSGAGQPDRRPMLVRRLWAGWNRNAGLGR
jgi:dipeptidase